MQRLMSKFSRVSLVIITLFVAQYGVAFAGAILQPTAVSTTATSSTPISQAIDQSGLAAPYVSGITDFDTYVASTGHGNVISTTWLSDLNFPKLVSFDLGGLFAIDGFALWHTFPNDTMKDFELFSDTDGIFGNGGTTSLGTFTAPNIVSGHSFAFSSTTTQFIHLNITSGHGGVDVRVGEFAFRQASVIPEPSTYLLFAVGISGIMGLGYRQRKKAV